MEKKEIKAHKKAFKKARSRATRPWKWLTWISMPFAIILTAATVICGMFDNTVALFTGDTFWKVVDEDENAVYYKGDFQTEEERIAAGAEIVKQVEAEGAVLLTNSENGLPLEEGAKISLFSTSSVNIVYGGTGSGNVDSSKCKNLKQALEEDGKFVVNPILWDFYLKGDASEYTRGNAGAVVQDSATEQVKKEETNTTDAVIASMSTTDIVEAPWSLYTEMHFRLIS